MDLETTQTTTTANLPILKQGEYDKWRLRIEQYFQVQDYVLWDVIENGNSFKPATQTTTNADGTSTSLIPGPVTTEEKVQKKNDVKARSFRRLNKPDIDTMSFDDLYNNFKIVKQEVKGTASSISSSSSQNMAFVSSSTSTNEVNTAYEVSTANTQVSPASTQVSTASTQVSTANLSDATVYAFLANQSNGSPLVHEDLEQIHKDDLEEMDLKWQLALLSMRTKRFFQKTGRKIIINGSDIAGYDKSKVECFNCHKMGYFARECREPRNQDSRNRNQDRSRRTVNVEETSSKAMVAIDGAGFDWSYMADDEVPTNMSLMAFSDSEVPNDKTCSKTYLKSFETFKIQLDDLRIKFNKSEFNLATYKRRLASVEEQLVFYKKNEVIFYEQLAVLKRDISYKDSKISMLKSELEKLKQEKESNQLKIEKFDNASKSLDKLIGSQITDKSRKPEFEGYRPKPSKSVSEDISNEVKESLNAPLVEELVSDDKLEKKTIFSTIAKIEFVRPKQQEKPVRKPVKMTTISIKGKWWNIVPIAVLMKTGLRPLNTARPINTAHPKTTVYSARPMPNSVVVNAVWANKVNAVKASACWVWRPTKLNSASITLKRHNYVDTRGRSKSGTCLISQTSRNLMEDMLPLGEEPKEGKLLVKELLKWMCDKKISVLFTNTGCFVLSLDFKLADESIKKEFSIAKTPKQNGIAERRNKTLIKAARTMLADSKLPTTFWAKAVNTTCYVQNKVFVVKPHNKTLYELFRGKTPTLSFMRSFGCHVTILNTLDYLGKFDRKSDEGFFIGYSLNSKAFRVYNIRTRKVEKNMHIRFLEDTPIIAGDGPKWLFDIDVLTKSMNYVPVVAGTNSNDFVDGSLFDSSLKNASNDEPQPSSVAGKKDDEGVCKESRNADQKKPKNNTQGVNIAGLSINTKLDMFSLGDNATLEATHANFFGDETEVDMSNITTVSLNFI
ncbi:ribonuclease H-like domain-containing protein [Tanacetum coccineum]|uniref:Ribonuclease H-like domain-containing protein n=1 Tax=Tanacetum coccineum TaxID=301880 RepID=A0ABQ5ECN0_9ASTR